MHWLKLVSDIMKVWTGISLFAWIYPLVQLLIGHPIPIRNFLIVWMVILLIAGIFTWWYETQLPKISL